MYAVINDKTGLIVGKFKTAQAARNKRDRLDEIHGGCNFSVVAA